MTKEEVLQKVNDYCTEKQYTVATLTDAFKDKFATHFQKANPDGDIDSDVVMANLKFALNTAFSSASELATVKQQEFGSKESDYKAQIDELKKQINAPRDDNKPSALSKELEDQLKELQEFKNEKTKQEKFGNIVKLAKASIRESLHASFDKFANDYDVVVEDSDEDQASYLVNRFQEIFKDSIGDIKPLAPKQVQKREEEFLASLKKVKVQ